MSIGLILEGGGMRGIFVAGVIDYFLEHDITFPNVIGVSMGACIGCSYVAKQHGRAYATTTDYIGNPEYCSMESLRKTGNYFGVDFVYHKIPEELYPIDNETFRNSDVKFQVAVTNCITGEAEYPVIKDLFKDIDIVRASASLPMLARMVPMNGYAYLDGGVADSIPIRQSVKQGNQKNVVVLTRPVGYRKNPINYATIPVKARYRRYPKLVEAVKNRNRMYNKTLDYLDREVAEGRAFVIAPMGPLDIGRTETDPMKMRKAYEEGYYVAEGLAEKLKAFMEEDT